MRAVHAVPAESSAGHRADRRCPCGPIAMRDLNTGMLNVWKHRTPTRAAEPLDANQRAAARDFARWADAE
jgi:hypothetical protein